MADISPKFQQNDVFTAEPRRHVAVSAGVYLCHTSLISSHRYRRTRGTCFHHGPLSSYLSVLASKCPPLGSIASLPSLPPKAQTEWMRGRHPKASVTRMIAARDCSVRRSSSSSVPVLVFLSVSVCLSVCPPPPPHPSLSLFLFLCAVCLL